MTELATIIDIRELRRAAHRQIPVAKQTPQGVCRWCEKPITKPDGTPDNRRRWHPDCVEFYLIRRNPRELRKFTFIRDRGVCAKCGRDTLAEFLLINPHYARYLKEKQDPGLAIFTKTNAFRFQDAMGNYWQADHVLPLKDGGSFEMVNVQTLCVPCHRIKTAEENSARSRGGKEPEPTTYAQAEDAGQQRLLDDLG